MASSQNTGSDPKRKRGKNTVPSLKSASGGGYTYEDKVAGTLLCEMLASRPSFAANLGSTQRLERQANDWEPFGDLLLTVADGSGLQRKIGCSVKSDRKINKNGCTTGFAKDAWKAVDLPVNQPEVDQLALLSAPISRQVCDRVNSLCNQAREILRVCRWIAIPIHFRDSCRNFLFYL